MTDLSDAELDGRLRAVGLLLDETAAQRAASLAGRRRRPPRRPLVLAAAVLVVVAIGAAAVLALRSDGSPEPDVLIDGTTTTTSQPTDLGARIRALGLTGEVVAHDTGLIDLATGEITPLVAPADILGYGASLAVPDGAGGLYYLSLAPEVEQTDGEGPDVFGREDLRHRTADGEDEIVQEGVYSFALRADGAIAMAIARDPVLTSMSETANDIVVQDPDGTRTTWSSAPGDHEVGMWAGDRLIVRRGHEDTEMTDDIVFDAPGEVRGLVDWGGASLIGPDGSWAVVHGLPPGSESPGDGGEPIPPRILDLATGEEVGTIDPGYAQRVGALRWVGDDRAVGISTVRQPGSDGQVGVLVELDVSTQGGEIRMVVTRRVILDDRTHVPDEVTLARDGTLLASASIIGATPGTPSGWGLWACRPDASGCDLVTLPFGDRGTVGFVDNPSRPLP